MPPNHPEYAKNYGPYLLNNGFRHITTGCWIPRKGDIIVIQNYPGGQVAWAYCNVHGKSMDL